MEQTRFYLLLMLLLVATVCGATTIQIKRGNDANLPATLKMGEIAMTRDTHRTFVGYSTGKVELQPILANYSCAGASYMKEYDSATGQWACTTPEGSGGSGSGTVSSGTTGQLAQYAADGTTVTGYTLPPYQPILTGVGAVELNGTDTGNRTTVWDWHSIDGVDFNTRMSKSSGLNSQFTINNKGISGTETGSIVLDTSNSIATGHQQVAGNLTVGQQYGAEAHLHVRSQDSTPTVYIDSYHDTAQPSIIGRRARGSISSPTQVTADTPLFNFAARTWFSDTSAWSTAGYASFTMKAAEAMDSTHHGTYMQFLTTQKGDNSNTERMRIYDDGGVQIGGTMGTSPGAGNVTASGTIATNSTGIVNVAAGSTLATSGANSITLTTTGATNVTLPTSGTLATTAQIPGVLTASETVDFASLANGSSTSANISVTGVAIGDLVDVSTSNSTIDENLRIKGFVSIANTVKVIVTNESGGTYDPPTTTVYVRATAHP
jgi:hypothetical protein